MAIFAIKQKTKETSQKIGINQKEMEIRVYFYIDIDTPRKKTQLKTAIESEIPLAR